MPAVIVIRITDEECAESCLAAGARDIALGFLPDACIRASKVTITYRTPENEAKALAGDIDYKQMVSTWSE